MTEEHVEEFVTRYADEKLTREEVEQAINYAIKNKEGIIIYSYLTEEERDELDEYNEPPDVEIFCKELCLERNEGWTDEDDEYNLENVVLEVGVWGNYHFITIDDLIDKSLTDCVIDLISDVVVKDKRKRATKKKGA